MQYCKTVSNGYIINVNTYGDGVEISESEYNALLDVIRAVPTEESKWFRLREDLTWESYDRPEMDDTVSDSEALEILLGGGV